jgi:hypothetical protein
MNWGIRTTFFKCLFSEQILESSFLRYKTPKVVKKLNEEKNNSVKILTKNGSTNLNSTLVLYERE